MTQSHPQYGSGSELKIPKYSCSACGRPSSRKWNLNRHISNYHAGIGKCLPNWDFHDTYRSPWNRCVKGINQDSYSSRYAEGLLIQSIDSKPDYQHVLTEACLKGLAKRVFSSIQPTQSMISSSFAFSSYSQHSLLIKYSVLQDTSAIN